LWEGIAKELPKLLVSDRLRTVLDQMPVLDADRLDQDQCERAMLLLSFLGHGYVWCDSPPADHVPPGIAVPWYQVAQRLGRPPVLSYASYALSNWKRFAPDEPVALGNIALLQNFLGGKDEEWFVLVHVDIEAKAGPALAAAGDAQDSAHRQDSSALSRHLRVIAKSLGNMNQTLSRMPEHCDPYIYYHRVRPFIHGWKDNPSLPNGLVYQGVEELQGLPQMFRGETGVQSSIIPAMDAALGVAHEEDPMRPYLLEMRQYMAPDHSAFIDALERGPSTREFVVQEQADFPELGDVYNDCLKELGAFRSKHFEYAASYVRKQSQQAESNPIEVGTGGTPFMPYLKKHLEETLEGQIRPQPTIY
jgi:indoleamine 2,3-dioxygenase